MALGQRLYHPASGHLRWSVAVPPPACICVGYTGQEHASSQLGSEKLDFGRSTDPNKLTGDKSHHFLSPPASDRNVQELNALLKLITQSSFQTK